MSRDNKTQSGSSDKKKKSISSKLNAEAVAFDVTSSPTFNPYSGQYGIATKPAYVPPAQPYIPPVSNLDLKNSTQGSNQSNGQNSNTGNISTHDSLNDVTETSRSANTVFVQTYPKNNGHNNNSNNSNSNNSNHIKNNQTSRSPPFPQSRIQYPVSKTQYRGYPYDDNGQVNYPGYQTGQGTQGQYGSNRVYSNRGNYSSRHGYNNNNNNKNNNNNVNNGHYTNTGYTNNYRTTSNIYNNNYHHQQNQYSNSSQLSSSGYGINQSGMVTFPNGRVSIDKSKPPFAAQTSHPYAKAVGVTVSYKTNHPRNNYHQPSSEEIDPAFTNTPELIRYQRWELLESAQRWLPGEGTFITRNGNRYLIGPPIHMGMNGHIHYCYKYSIPKYLTKKDDENVVNNVSNKDDIKNDIDNNNTTNLNELNDFASRPNVETVVAKIVPNTRAFAREIVILRALQDCENVAELFEVLESERTLISILELAQADVYNFFVGRVSKQHGWNLEKPAIREHFARMVISNVVQGLDQMHKSKYLHCDLKSLNILLYIYITDHSNRRGGVYVKAKITDFGHSSHGEFRIAEKLFQNGMARVGTAGHVAPELFIEGTKCDCKIDIWSLGIVMFSMLVPGRLLFGEYTDLNTLKRAYDRINKMNPWSRERPSWWNDFERLSPEARDLILLLTRFDPKERPTCEKILQHPWFKVCKTPRRGPYRPRLKYVDMICASSIAQE